MMRSKRQRNRFEPALETLEDRCTPAVTLAQNGDTLVITGDAAADIVVVTANFNNNFTVVANGAAGQTFNGIRTIEENLGDGGNMASRPGQQRQCHGQHHDRVRERPGARATRRHPPHQ